MVLDLKDVFACEGTSYHVDTTLDLRREEIRGGYPFTSDVKISADFQNRSGMVTLEICTDFDYTADCDRCSESVTRRFEYRFFHRLIANLEEEYNDEYIETPDMTLDLSELVLSDVLLELPSKFLCKGDCQGLCQKCGQNLNLGYCDCVKQEIDPRLEKLKQLLD